MTDEHLKQLKLHLCIDYDDDDLLLNVYYNSAVGDVETITKRPLFGDILKRAICENEENLPDLIWQFIMLRIGDYYQQRELSAEKPYNVYYKHLLDRYINYANTDEI